MQYASAGCYPKATNTNLALSTASLFTPYNPFISPYPPHPAHLFTRVTAAAYRDTEMCHSVSEIFDLFMILGSTTTRPRDTSSYDTERIMWSMVAHHCECFEKGVYRINIRSY